MKGGTHFFPGITRGKTSVYGVQFHWSHLICIKIIYVQAYFCPYSSILTIAGRISCIKCHEAHTAEVQDSVARNCLRRKENKLHFCR